MTYNDWENEDLGVPGQPEGVTSSGLGLLSGANDGSVKKWIKDNPILKPAYGAGTASNAQWNPYYPPTYPSTPAFCNHLVGDVSIKVKQMEDELVELLDAIDAQKLGTAGTHVESLLEDLEQIRQALLI